MNIDRKLNIYQSTIEINQLKFGKTFVVHDSMTEPMN